MERKEQNSLPAELVAHVSAGCGDPGLRWLKELPTLIRRLEMVWSVRVGKPFPGIEYNFVAPAQRSSGEAVVIKIHPPWDPVEIFDEAAYLRTRAGDGCVRLLAVDEPARAILLERLVPGRTLVEMFSSRKPDAVGPAIEVLRRITRPAENAPADAPSLDGWFTNFESYKETDFPASYASKALGLYHDLMNRHDRPFYLHGDFHPGNIVSSDRGPFLAIDPKGIVGPLGYEIAVFLNNFHWWQETEPEVMGRLDMAVKQFAEAFDIPADEIRQWAYAQMVLGAWWTYSDLPDLYDGSVVKADVWGV